MARWTGAAAIARVPAASLRLAALPLCAVLLLPASAPAQDTPPPGVPVPSDYPGLVDGDAGRGPPERAPSASGSAAGDEADQNFLLPDGGFADLPRAVLFAPLGRPADPESLPAVDEADALAESAAGDGPPGGAVPQESARIPIPAPAERRQGDTRIVTPNPAPPAGDGRAPAEAAPVRVRIAASDEEFQACLARLDALGTAYEPVEPIRSDAEPDCGIERPLAVSTIVPGVALRPDAVMRCDTARALAEWVAEDVLPAAGSLSERGALTTIDHGSTYICRRRNNAATGKLSEHSFGNAVDVMGFRFASGEPIRIEPREPGGPAAAFQRTVREASCEHFTTVIGPGTNAAHADHLHLDVKERRGGYRLCE